MTHSLAELELSASLHAYTLARARATAAMWGLVDDINSRFYGCTLKQSYVMFPSARLRIDERVLDRVRVDCDTEGMEYVIYLIYKPWAWSRCSAAHTGNAELDAALALLMDSLGKLDPERHINGLLGRKTE